ncbi:YceI family protein [Rubrimonas cliftonensis]|uniref:Polyisoprenoid-binding protein YceI n=1 Tax=Rubrimonas cliftonensis TaxID=89524 RepID=A0A1H4C2L7_9RHOB|nr:YceI family protein [Rubrimonas cliftonensis]SEA54608.1 Polyisoprenoid-binding protein YceI [Rubrimonas cliftonensis]
MRPNSLAAALGAAALAAAVIAAPAFAAERWNIDKSHAHISFQADHLGFSVVQGQFREFDGDIMFDPENIEATEVSFTVQAASVDTFWPKRDEHIRSADFLNVAEHPTITFVSTGVEKTGDDTATITGDLTMIGETREVSFEATLNKLGPSPFNPDQTIAGFVIEGVITRADFGMTYGGDAFAARIPVRVDLEISPANPS